MIPEHAPQTETSPTANRDSPLPIDMEHVSAYAWQRGAVETILFHGAARLATAAGPLDLECGTWLLVRWDGPPLEDTPDGELVCILPEKA
jgi:hypothetical protein